MIARYSYRGLAWIDMESPTREELDHLKDEFTLPASLCAELQSNSIRSKIDTSESYTYLALHFPTIERSSSIALQEQEVDFVIGKDFIVTVRYGAVEPLKHFAKLFEANMFHFNQYNNAGVLFIEMMRQLYLATADTLDSFLETISDIGKRALEDTDKQAVIEISEMNEAIIVFKQIIRLHHGPLSFYERVGTRNFGDEYSFLFAQVFYAYNTIVALLDESLETLMQQQRTNDSIRAVRQATAVRRLTVITFITFPLLLIAGIFGISTTEKTVIIRSHADFFFVIAAMLITALVTVIFLKYEKWL